MIGEFFALATSAQNGGRPFVRHAMKGAVRRKSEAGALEGEWSGLVPRLGRLRYWARSLRGKKFAVVVLVEQRI